MMKRREELLMGSVMGLLFQKLRLISVVTGSIVALFLCLLAFSETSSAVSITVDEIIFNNDPHTNTSLLAGTVDMTFDTDANVLWITLANTTGDVVSVDASNNLLTGLGFSLPTGIDILSGSVSAAGQTQINFPVDGAGEPIVVDDVSGEWGFANEQQGQFNNAVSSIDTIVSAMTASTDEKFSNMSVGNHPVLAGPDFGLLSSSVDSSVAGGLAAIQNSVMIHLFLTDSTPDNVLELIEEGDVVISFGSSNSSTTPVPEPATIALLGIGLAGLAGGAARRKWKKRAVADSKGKKLLQ